VARSSGQLILDRSFTHLLGLRSRGALVADSFVTPRVTLLTLATISYMSSVVRVAPALLGSAPSDARATGGMRAEPFDRLRTALVEVCAGALRQAHGA
jgi:hypothetical protein